MGAGHNNRRNPIITSDSVPHIHMPESGGSTSEQGEECCSTQIFDLPQCSMSLPLKASALGGSGVRNKDSSVEHAIMSVALSPNSSSSIDNRNLDVFPYKLNLFTKKSVQRCRALSNNANSFYC